MPFTHIDGAVVTVEAALSADTGTYAIWDGSTWDSVSFGPDVVYVDISAYVRTINTNRAFSRDLQTWESGTATVVLDNRGGQFSPSNLTGPYVVTAATYTQTANPRSTMQRGPMTITTSGTGPTPVTMIRPWRPLRISVTWAGVTRYLFTGYATAWEESYDPSGPRQGDAIVTVPCVDELAALARFDGVAQAPVGAGDSSGTRIHRILDNAGHHGTRDVDLGYFTMQATDLGDNTVNLLKITADSEGGAVYVGADGTLIFDDAYALVNNARSSTVQSTWGDDPTTGELPYSDIAISYNGDLVVNIAAFQRVGGAVQTATDPTSRALYGAKRVARQDFICETDDQVTRLAQLYVMTFARPELRTDQITVLPRSNPAALYPQVLGREVRDLVQVNRRPPGSYTISLANHISGISHAITGDNWVTTFSLFSASTYQAIGRWDSAVWDSATWFF